MVPNHSGGLIAMDVPVIAVAYFDHYGMDAPLYVLAHDMLWLDRKTGTAFDKVGFVKATRENARAVLENGGTALEAGVPLVPVVTIGGQEQMYMLWRGEAPDIAAAVDEEVRRRMQAAMDELAEQRRFPVIG